jgi:branched-subunit amino acid aminotransferase/4-amino-4-deoxychorismate lyase
MQKFIFINHQLIPEKQGRISINERGFLFGDGIFETCKIFAGRIYNFDQHQNRIKAGLKALKFSAPIANLEENCLKLITKNKIKNGILRISISRGIGSLGYLPTYESEALIIIQTFDERPRPKNISLGIATQKTPIKSLGKTKNALPYVLTKIEAQEKKLFDLVMLSEKKFIGETSSANIFWVKNDKVFTATKSCGILLGNIRKKLLKISPVKIYETEAKIAALKNADEIFLTNSSFLLLSVDQFLGKKLNKDWGNKFFDILQQDLIKQCKN